MKPDASSMNLDGVAIHDRRDAGNGVGDPSQGEFQNEERQQSRVDG